MRVQKTHTKAFKEFDSLTVFKVHTEFAICVVPNITVSKVLI